MVIIPLDVAPQTVLPVLTGLGHRLTPEVRGVSHDQQTEFVGPVKLTGNLHLDVDPVTVQTKFLREQDLILHELIAREGVETFRVVTLVKAELQIDGLVVKGDISVFLTGEVDHPDFPLPEIAIDGISSNRSRYLVEERIVQIPKVLVLDRNHERSFVLAFEITRECVLPTGLEGQFEGFTGSRGRSQGHVHLDGRVVDVRREM